MFKTIKTGVLTLGLFAALSAVSAQATTITYYVSGQASATIETQTDQVIVTLSDLWTNPADVVGNLSALSFTLDLAPSSGSLTSSSGIERSVNADGTYSDGSAVPTGWVFSLAGFTTTLNDLIGTGHAGPAHTIIGAPDANNVYSAANGSITGNGPHNPFLAGSATFIISELGVTANTVVTAATFQFGSANGENQVPGTPQGSTPEPGTWVLLLGGCSLVLISRARMNRQPAACKSKG